ncbi:YbhB/YbcL family Raf kinase inhibitor-like protein [Thermoflexus sp.]|uniref:YbhB/YbcL family Raf kinase inhibitor-like protein n=1 Tax=Thermoflexus sp. TaxID=1969742 RepID=UPI0035E40679
MRNWIGVLWMGILLLFGVGCGVATPAFPRETPTHTLSWTVTPVLEREPTSTATPGGSLPDLRLRSPAFAEGETIPREYTCDGADRSPPLRWDPPPPGTRSLALVMDDPDAPGGRFVHWTLYGIPPERTELPEGLPAHPALEGIGRQGRNDFRRIGYGGPCPPPGPPHRYRFTLYALDIPPELPPGASPTDVERALEGHILAVGRLTGRYGR